jgi:hypothetical protein
VTWGAIANCADAAVWYHYCSTDAQSVRCIIAADNLQNDVVGLAIGKAAKLLPGGERAGNLADTFIGAYTTGTGIGEDRALAETNSTVGPTYGDPFSGTYIGIGVVNPWAAAFGH